MINDFCPRCQKVGGWHELWCSWPAEASDYECQAMQDEQAEKRGYPVR